jgi:hypothetical protein
MKKIALIALTTLTLISCGKKETNLLSVKNGMIHSWELYMQGSDNNNNNKFETSEGAIVEETARYTYQFKGDNTGFKVGYNNASVDSLKWELNDNETYIIISFSDAGVTKKHSYAFDFGTDFLTLRDTTTQPAGMSYYKRKD